MTSSKAYAYYNIVDIVVCSWGTFFYLYHSINSKWQFLYCATIAFSERYKTSR